MGHKLLVVDDEPIVRQRVVAALQDAGYAVVDCDDGQKALALVRDEKPDLVLMDVEMPGLGGREVCRIIKGSKGFGFLPVILMTASDDVQTKVEGLEMGADDYLIKPLNPLELSARVKTMLRLKTLQDELVEANRRLKGMNERLQALSTTDALTGINNRMVFDRRMDYEFQRSSRYRKPLTLLLLDLDHFKRINDTHGHPFGDEVLKAVADVINKSTRNVDIVARYGGEEFVVVLPETDLPQSQVVAERIRQGIETREVSQGNVRDRVTVSIGMASFPATEYAGVESLIQAADDALYAAKKAGRNCIRVAG